MSMAEQVRPSLEQDGYCIVAPVLTGQQIESLLYLLRQVEPDGAVRAKNGSIYAIRNVLDQVPGLKQFVARKTIRDLASKVIGDSARIVRAIYFDKTKEANWMVPWHQDCTIAVRARLAVEGFDLWTVKSGIHHVCPPEQYMQRMLTLRVHLDVSDEDNGALKVIPGSHRKKLTDSEVAEVVKSQKSVTCTVPAGGILLLKPLLLHASSTGKQPRHRRVLHLEFSPDTLPHGLEWYDAV